MAEKKFIGEVVELAGNVDECGHCEEGDEFFSDKAEQNPAIKYEYHHEGSPEYDEIKGGRDFHPVIRHCKLNEKGQKVQCRTVEGFDPTDWSLLGATVTMDTNTDLEEPIEI